MDATAKKTIEKQPGWLVFISGLSFSLLALFVVRTLRDHDVNIMGWYVNGILPAGALFVGMASGLGFAVASRYLNVRLTRSYVLGMLTTGLLDYAAAQYLSWQDLLEAHNVAPERYSLWQYFRDTCEHMTFRSSRGGSDAGSPLGSFGYFFKLLEITGFAVGTMLPSAILFGMPYCRSCQRYLLKHRMGHLNGTARRDEVLRLDKQGRQGALQEAVSEVSARAQQLFDTVHSSHREATEAALAQTEALDKHAAARIDVTMKKCPTCDSHHLTFTLHHSTVDKRVAAKNLLTLDKASVAAAAAPVAASDAPAAPAA